MMRRGLVVSLALLMVSVRSSNNEPMVIETKAGKVEGLRQKAANGQPVDMWWGIPYAEPPLADLRFRPPKPIQRSALAALEMAANLLSLFFFFRWTGIKKAHHRPNSCVQIVDMMFQGFPGAEMWNPNTKQDEDCLYLNIAVPVPRPNNSAVMVSPITSKQEDYYLLNKSLGLDLWRLLLQWHIHTPRLRSQNVGE